MSYAPNSVTQLTDHVLTDLVNLHAIKARAYGHSWRKHGEYLSIFANITRKADRLFEGGVDTPDETRLDTVADLAVYSLLYLSWLYGAEDEADEGIAVSASAVASLIGLTTPVNVEYRAKLQYEQLENLILHQIERQAHVSESDEYRTTVQARKRQHVRSLAALCVLWLAQTLYTRPDDYAAWAHKWRTPESESAHAE